MPAFHYIALNQEQKELSGVIEAPDETSALKKLGSLGLSTVSIKVTEGIQHDEKENKLVFSFEGFDKNGKRVSGTISSKDAISAYSRLRDEYIFNVISLISANLPDSEKEAALKLGIESLRAEYEKLAAKNKKTTTAEDQSAELAKQRTELLEKVDLTMKRMEAFLAEYGADIKVEEKNNIQAFLNQLFRIKDSTNLEHIKTTCEKMLQYVQKQELFVQEELKLRESSKIKVETSEMLQSLKQTGMQQDIDLAGILVKLENYAILKPSAQFFLRVMSASTPEARKLKREIKNINHHIFEYVKLLFIGKSKGVKADAWQSILALRQEKHRIKMQIHALMIEEKNARLAGRPESRSLENVAIAIGWVLAFYLVSYIVAYPFTIKKFEFIGSAMPMNFYFYKTNLTKIATLLLFLTFFSLQIRNYWLKQSPFASVVVFSATIFGFLLTLINLL